MSEWGDTVSEWGDTVSQWGDTVSQWGDTVSQWDDIACYVIIRMGRNLIRVQNNYV